MSKNLTKNARWICFWAKYKYQDDTHDIYIPHSVVFNLGRHPYSTPTLMAINKSLDFSKDVVLESKVFECDVKIAKYAKQHDFVTQMATEYFKRQRVLKEQT